MVKKNKEERKEITGGSYPGVDWIEGRISGGGIGIGMIGVIRIMWLLIFVILVESGSAFNDALFLCCAYRV